MTRIHTYDASGSIIGPNDRVMSSESYGRIICGEFVDNLHFWALNQVSIHRSARMIGLTRSFSRKTVNCSTVQTSSSLEMDNSVNGPRDPANSSLEPPPRTIESIFGPAEYSILSGLLFPNRTVFRIVGSEAVGAHAGGRVV